MRENALVTWGEDLKREREARGLSQRELASQLGIAQSHLSRLESADKEPKSKVARRIATELGLARPDDDRSRELFTPEASGGIAVAPSTPRALSEFSTARTESLSAGPKNQAGDERTMTPLRVVRDRTIEGEPVLQLIPPRGDKKWQEFFLPIHDLVRLRAGEVQIANHPAVQRLGEVLQLGQVHFVYRGATHRRFEHSLGTLHVTQMMIDRLNENCIERGSALLDRKWVPDAPLTSAEIAFTRLGALLHDLGHLPAGHTLEDEIGLLPHHDADARLNRILDRERWRGTGVSPKLGDLIDALYAQEAAESKLDKPAVRSCLI